jgi:YD repeat-containing protein
VIVSICEPLIARSSTRVRSYSAKTEVSRKLPISKSAALANSAEGDGLPAIGIREDIPTRFQKKYHDWKEEFLSTQTGRQEWGTFASATTFLLTITVSNENVNGGATGRYRWDDSGNLIGATITLGQHLDRGYPSPVYYPVMSSLSIESSNQITSSILAATKIAHEFGHVRQMMTTDGRLYRLQSQLVPTYNAILLRNGYDVRDPRLIELAQLMGGTPVQIWEDREYWGEANALLFLRDRFANEAIRCRLFRRIKQTVQLYAKDSRNGLKR